MSSDDTFAGIRLGPATGYGISYQPNNEGQAMNDTSNFPGITGGFASPYAADLKTFQNLSDKLTAWTASEGLAWDVGSKTPGVGAGSMGGAASFSALGMGMPWYMKAALAAAAVAAVVVLTRKK